MSTARVADAMRTMGALRTVAAGALALGAGLAATGAPAAGQSGPPAQLGITVTPTSVRIGDPFVIRVRIRAPRGSQVEFPLAPDSGSRVELIDPRQIRTTGDSGAVDVTAVYRAAAWDVGTLPLGLADATVRLGAAERRVPLDRGARVIVQSVLPADSAAPRDPKPPRALLDTPVPWWRRWLPYLLAALALAALLTWLWRRRRRQPAVAADPFAEAEAGFARVERLGLLEAGERGRYVALVVEVLRDYLARRVPDAGVSLTSTELVARVQGSPAVPAARLAPLLAEADLVKFARLPITTERAVALAQGARAVASETEQATRRIEEERRAAEAAAARPPQVTTKQRREPPTRAA